MSESHFEVTVGGTVHRVSRAEVARLAAAVAAGPGDDLAARLEASAPDGQLVSEGAALATERDDLTPPSDPHAPTNAA